MLFLTLVQFSSVQFSLISTRLVALVHSNGNKNNLNDNNNNNDNRASMDVGRIARLSLSAARSLARFLVFKSKSEYKLLMSLILGANSISNSI